MSSFKSSFKYIKNLHAHFALFIFAFLLLSTNVVFAQDATPFCLAKATTIHLGMSRAQIELQMNYDGGVSGTFKDERLFFKESNSIEHSAAHYQTEKVCMLNIDFRPNGIPDEIYNNRALFLKWLEEHHYQRTLTDFVVKISSPFNDFFHAD